MRQTRKLLAALGAASAASIDSGRAQFRGIETFKRFQQVCAVLVSAVHKGWPKSKIRKIASDMTVQLDGSEGKCIKEDGLEFYGERRPHEFTTNPGKVTLAA